MAEPLKLYMDQILRRDVAQALLGEATTLCVRLKSAKPEQMTMRYCRKRLLRIESLLLLMNILVIG